VRAGSCVPPRFLAFGRRFHLRALPKAPPRAGFPAQPRQLSLLPAHWTRHAAEGRGELQDGGEGGIRLRG
jgi:hypothetical protein